MDRPGGTDESTDLPDGHFLRRLSVDLLDEVAALDARFRGGRSRHGGDNEGVSEALGDDEADTVVFDVAEILVRRHLCRRDVVAELVDGVGDPGEGTVHQLIGRHLFHVVVPHKVEDLGEDAEVAVDVVLLRGLPEQRATEEREEKGHRNREENDFLFGHYAVLVVLVVFATAAISADLQACCPAGFRSRGSRNAPPPTRRHLQSSVQR